MIRDAVARKLFGERVRHGPQGKVYNNVTHMVFYPSKRKATVHYESSGAAKKVAFLDLSEVQFGDPINIYWVEGPKRKGLIEVDYRGREADAWIEKDPDTRLRILMISN